MCFANAYLLVNEETDEAFHLETLQIVSIQGELKTYISHQSDMRGKENAKKF